MRDADVGVERLDGGGQGRATGQSADTVIEDGHPEAALFFPGRKPFENVPPLAGNDEEQALRIVDGARVPRG